MSRTPHGVRGLKYEIKHTILESIRRRTPHGVRGLKFLFRGTQDPYQQSRTPHGVRGLKSLYPCRAELCTNKSHPARGAWIEIR